MGQTLVSTWTQISTPPFLPRAAYSTTRRKFETELDEIQENELILAQEKGLTLQKVFCTRVWQQLRLRSAFLATPTSVWGFLILLGMITVFAV